MKGKNIAIIGGGKMGLCLAGGLLADGYPANAIRVANPHIEKLQPLKAQWPVSIMSDNREAIRQADIVILAVKPAVVPTVIDELRSLRQETTPLLISVVTGVKIDYFTNQLGSNYPIVRCMPNTCVSVKAGITGIYAPPAVSEEARDCSESILRSLGVTLWLKEEALLDVITAVSGSGPAYFFYIMDALQSIAETLGLPHDQAKLLVTQTALGATKLAMETQCSFETLQEQVTSKGGTTAAAIEVFEKQNVHNILSEAVQAAYQRAQALSEMS